MLMTKERRPAVRTLRGSAIEVLNEAGAIRECEHHGWMQDRADPQAHRPPATRLICRRSRQRGVRCPGFDRRHLSGMSVQGP